MYVLINSYLYRYASIYIWNHMSIRICLCIHQYVYIHTHIRAMFALLCIYVYLMHAGLPIFVRICVYACIDTSMHCHSHSTVVFPTCSHLAYPFIVNRSYSYSFSRSSCSTSSRTYSWTAVRRRPWLQRRFSVFLVVLACLGAGMGRQHEWRMTLAAFWAHG